MATKLKEVDVVLVGFGLTGGIIAKELSGRDFFVWERVLLATGKVHQNCDVYRESCFAFEGEDLLRPSVLEHGDLVLSNIADDTIVSIDCGEQNVDQIGPEL